MDESTTGSVNSFLVVADEPEGDMQRSQALGDPHKVHGTPPSSSAKRSIRRLIPLTDVVFYAFIRSIHAAPERVTDATDATDATVHALHPSSSCTS